MRNPIEIEGVGRLHFVDTYEGGIYKVLVLDDSKEYLSSVRDFLLEQGIDHVDTVSTTLEATEKLGHTQYDAVLADIFLYDPTENQHLVRGDEWLLAQHSNLENVFKAAVTGFPKAIRDVDVLKRNGIVVIAKGDAAEVDLYDELARRAIDKKIKLEQRLEQVAHLIREAANVEIPIRSERPLKPGQLSARLAGLPRCEDNHSKGREFESLVADIFSSIPGISVVDRNRRLIGEEFDLVLENNITGTFWSSLNSPFFLVECKNRTEKTGAPDAAQLCAKLLKHRNLTRFGFMVSLAEFSRGALVELKRYGATDLCVALIGIDDLEEVCNDTRHSEEWLKRIILRSLL